MPSPATGKNRRSILAWLLGFAVLAAVVSLLLRGGDAALTLQLLREASPAWLLLALVLQAGTYSTVAASWGVVLARGGERRPVGMLYSLALIALFTNQALPVAGLAGIVVVIDVLTHQGVPRSVALAAVMVDELGYLASYGIAVALSLIVLGAAFELPSALLGMSAAALAAGIAIVGLLLALTRPGLEVPAFLQRWGWTKRLAETLLDADPTLVRSPSLALATTALRGANQLLDALTFWACLQALGQPLSIPQASVAFIIASLGRSLGVVPGGLGTFEGAAVGALVLVGIPIEPGLAATLLFRALSFWLPMLPGLWLVRSLRREHAHA